MRAAVKKKSSMAPRGLPDDAPRVALVGRPNVGKSTLFNRLIRSNRAITHDMPGITRDRLEGWVRRDGLTFVIIDTGGVTLDAHEGVVPGPPGLRGFEEEILAQTRAAVEEAAALCLVVDGRDGLTNLDEHLAAYLRKSGKPILLAVNKVDGPEKADLLMAEFHSLGLPMLPCSAAHGFNMRQLEEDLRDLLPLTEDVEEAEEEPDSEPAAEGEEEVAEEDANAPLRLAMLGRPNAGKSSLVNSLSGSGRMIVSDVAGTTRDSVDVRVEKDGLVCTFVDTAGVRRPSRVTDSVERYSVNSALKSSSKAQVTLLVLDGAEGVTQQDKRLIDLLDERRANFMVLVNKCDLIPRGNMKVAEKDYRAALEFCPHVPLLFVSALKKANLGKILPLAGELRRESKIRISTGKLNKAMDEVLSAHQPPLVRGARAKFYYLTQAETNPPTFVFFVNNNELVKDSYARYWEKSLRRVFGIKHAAMRVHFRSSHKKDKQSK